MPCLEAHCVYQLLLPTTQAYFRHHALIMPLAMRFNGHLLNNELHEFQSCIRITERNLSKIENCEIMNPTKLGLMVERKYIQ